MFYCSDKTSGYWSYRDTGDQGTLGSPRGLNCGVAFASDPEQQRTNGSKSDTLNVGFGIRLCKTKNRSGGDGTEDWLEPIDAADPGRRSQPVYLRYWLDHLFKSPLYYNIGVNPNCLTEKTGLHDVQARERAFDWCCCPTSYLADS